MRSPYLLVALSRFLVYYTLRKNKYRKFNEQNIDISYKNYYSKIDKYHEISDASGNALIALAPPLNRYTDDAYKIKSIKGRGKPRPF